MSNSHLDNLKHIRSQLVELRRSRALYGVNNDIESAAAHIVEIQAMIAATDIAIEDEQKLFKTNKGGS